MIEEIIKILDKRYSRYKELLAHQQGTAEEIYQLFELNWVTEMRNDPEVLTIIKESLKARKEGRVQPWSQVEQELGIEPKPDESRLLNFPEKLQASELGHDWLVDYESDIEGLLEAQDARTASIMSEEWAKEVNRRIDEFATIKDAECQEKCMKAYKEGYNNGSP